MSRSELKRLVFQGKELVGVRTCVSSSNPADVTFGTLEKLGLLTRDIEFESHDSESATFVWTVVGDLVFTDEWGNRHQRGDVIRWYP